MSTIPPCRRLGSAQRHLPCLCPLTPSVLRPSTPQKYGAYATWLDVYVTLTTKPISTLTGALGSTFKAAQASTALSGSFSARVQ